MNDVPKEIQKNFHKSLGLNDFDWEVAAIKFLVGNSIVHQTNIGGRRIYIETREGWEGIKWVVLMDGWTLGKDGEYHYEPRPSNRTDEYIEITRFDDKEEALEALQLYELTNQGKDIKLIYS